MPNTKEITRQVFRDMQKGPLHFLYYVFYIFFVIEIILLGFGLFTLFRKYLKGRKDPVSRIEFPNILIKGIKGFFFWSSDTKIDSTDFKVKWAHRIMLLGYFILFLGTSYITVNQDLLIIILGFKSPGTFYGAFYMAFSFAMDVAGLITILSLVYLIYRRYSGQLRLDYTRADKREFSHVKNKWKKDDAFFLGYILSTVVVGFILEGVRIVADSKNGVLPWFEVYSIVGYPLAMIFQVLGLSSGSGIEALYLVIWWFHFFQSVFFFSFVLPYTKGMHMLTSYLSLVTSDPLSGNRLPKKIPANTNYGYSTIKDLTWRDLISLDACTKCGRCHVSCPAQTVGQPLSPRDVILDLREQAAVTLSVPEYSFRYSSNKSRNANQILVGSEGSSPILNSTIWCCTTCRACMQMCPVSIEHIPLIVQLRRGLIESGSLDSGIQKALERVSRYGNSFGVSKKQRIRWTNELPFQIKDARKEKVEFLWFVGDTASFDQRAFSDTILLAKILNYIGINYGIVFESEKTAGNDIRRVGEEGLYEMLVDDNLTILKKCNFEKIITTDPHTLNTLRYEYPEFDDEFLQNKEPSTFVIHYTNLLWSLIQSHQIILKKKFSGKVTYHDPCYLGRYSGEYNAPRFIIKELGFDLVEMPRSKEKSFCCGAGGGLFWKAESQHGETPALNRMKEAESINIQKFFVACPKDKIMFTDAGKGFNFEVIDIIQYLYEAMEIDN